MKIGLLSDIHANAYALSSVFNAAKKLNVKKIIFCGDYVGYYFEPSKVLSLLNRWDWIGIKGNHESMLINILKKDFQKKINKKYGLGLYYASKKLTQKQIKYLIDLPDNENSYK